MSNAWEVGRPTDAEVEAAFDMLAISFGRAPDPDERQLDRRILPPDQLWVARDEGDVVGVTGDFPVGVTVPGGASVAAAGVTAVAVSPTSRRRGVLTALMREQLAGTRTPLAALYCSETGIYGRFGYGLAADALILAVDTRLGQVPRGSGQVRLIDSGKARPALAAIHDVARQQRPGGLAHQDILWDLRLFDSDAMRRGRSPLRCVLYTGPDGPDGFALYRTKVDFVGDLPGGEAWVEEIVTTTAEAAQGLWSYLLGLDLVRTVHASVPLDDPLLTLLPERRAAHPQFTDNLWIRLVDLPAALTARSYVAPLDVVLDVRDDLLAANHGRWRMVAGASGATCERTDAPADVTLGVGDLGAAYLGSRSLVGLAAAGRVQGHSAAIEKVARGFGWPVAAYCGVGF